MYFCENLNTSIYILKIESGDAFILYFQEWFKARQEEAEEAAKNVLARKMARQAMRKRHRAELMVPHLQHLNFVLYWPHATNAHPELYERWDCHS